MHNRINDTIVIFAVQGYIKDKDMRRPFYWDKWELSSVLAILHYATKE